MEINAKMIQDLRERTGAGFSDCKKALVETGADMDKAVDFLRKKGIAAACFTGTLLALGALHLARAVGM